MGRARRGTHEMSIQSNIVLTTPYIVFFGFLFQGSRSREVFCFTMSRYKGGDITENKAFHSIHFRDWFLWTSFKQTKKVNLKNNLFYSTVVRLIKTNSNLSGFGKSAKIEHPKSADF